MSNKKMTELSEIGEFGLIEKLAKDIKITNKSTIKGIGDDAAVLNLSNNLTVVTTDMLIEGVHFDLGYVPLRHLGYKSVVVNISDVYAMNAKPKQITVSIAVSNRFPYEAIEELYEGIKAACENYKVDIIGGDTSSSHKGIAISITAIGEVEKDKVVYRNTANAGDLICVSGDLGAAYVGLQLLEREKYIYQENPKIQPNLSGHEYILQKQLKPEARYDIINFFNSNNIVPTSMIDISDGLSSEIIHICSQFGLGCDIYEDKIPIAQQTIDMSLEFNIDPIVTALSGGEDYELLFTVSPEDVEKIKANNLISIIGNITKSNDMNLIAKDGTKIPMTAQGWNAMR